MNSSSNSNSYKIITKNTIWVIPKSHIIRAMKQIKWTLRKFKSLTSRPNHRTTERPEITSAIISNAIVMGLAGKGINL